MATPYELSSVVQVSVLKGPSCQATNVPLTVVNGSYVEIPVNKTEIAGSAWLTEFMSFAYDKEKQTIYALLDNGTLIKSLNFT